MGKNRLVSNSNTQAVEGSSKQGSAAKSSKRKLDVAVLHVQATYNNTTAVLTDEKGNAVFSSSSGALGFSGAKKGTPFAAAKVGEVLGEKAKAAGVREISVVVKGVGSGRDSFSSKGIGITRIVDETPVPHNGPKPPKPR